MTHLPDVGEIVHVRGDEGACSPAIVMAQIVGPDGLVSSLRCRVLYRAPVTEPVGSRDVEAVYPPHSAGLRFTNPDGTSRPADSWHWRHHLDMTPPDSTT